MKGEKCSVIYILKKATLIFREPFSFYMSNLSFASHF